MSAIIENFNSLQWHDSELLELKLDRRHPGEHDSVEMKIKWCNSSISDLVFNDCYFFEAKMNFGIITAESIHSAECLASCALIGELEKKWESSGISLGQLYCFEFLTNSTNSNVIICAKQFQVT